MLQKLLKRALHGGRRIKQSCYVLNTCRFIQSRCILAERKLLQRGEDWMLPGRSKGLVTFLLPSWKVAKASIKSKSSQSYSESRALNG